MPQIRGIIFDMDGTLVDSRLDYNAMRQEMGLPKGASILEAIAAIPDGPERDRMVETMRIHELRGADSAVLIDGVIDFLSHIDDQGIVAAILTRNSRESTHRTLNRLNLSFSKVVTREDAPPKPDPAGVHLIVDSWGLSTHQVIVIGDYVYDLQAGRRAGMRNVLFAPNELPHFADQADYVLKHFREARSLLHELHAGDE